MTFPSDPGHVPVNWSEQQSPGEDEPIVLDRILGCGAADIGTAVWLPDDVDAMADALIADGRDFDGAFVPLVIHDPQLAERSIDAAEWAADLIAAEGGTYFCVAPFAEREWTPKSALTSRQWNHAAAMIERVEELCERFSLQIFVKETIGERSARGEVDVDPPKPVHFVLDTGNFMGDGFVSARLISPEQISSADPAWSDRLKGFWRNLSQ